MSYYAEIERYFIKKRGRGLMLSPKDWQVMSEWRAGGIPLRVVLQGIDKAFNQKGSQKREINFLAYCKAQVAECRREYQKQTLGAAAELSADKPVFPQKAILRHLSGFKRELQTKLKTDAKQHKSWLTLQHSLEELITPAQAGETAALAHIESKLEVIRQQLLEVLRDIMPPGELSRIETEVEAELKSYRHWMRPEAYQATYDELLGEWVFRFHGLSELRLYEL